LTNKHQAAKKANQNVQGKQIKKNTLTLSYCQRTTKVFAFFFEDAIAFSSQHFLKNQQPTTINQYQASSKNKFASKSVDFYLSEASEKLFFSWREALHHLQTQICKPQ